MTKEMLRSSSMTNNNVFIFGLRGSKPARQSPTKDVGYYNKIVINIKFPTIYLQLLFGAFWVKSDPI